MEKSCIFAKKTVEKTLDFTPQLALIRIISKRLCNSGFSHSFLFFNFCFANSLAFFLNFAPENKLLSI